MGSTRFPGKSMAPLAGHPLLWQILERVKRVRLLDAIVLATTAKPEDDVLEGVAASCGISVFRGSESDLVDRYYQAAIAWQADAILRLPADNPTPEPSEFDRIIEFHKRGDTEFSSNLAQVLGNGYPDGIGAEVYSFAAFAEVWKHERDAERREHPHLSFFNYKTQSPVNPDKYRVGTVPCPAEFRRPDLVLDVNTPADYEFMAELYAYLYPRNNEFRITDVIRWYDDVYRPRHGGPVPVK